MVAVIVKARHYFPRVERNFVKHRREILRLDDASVASGVHGVVNHVLLLINTLNDMLDHEALRDHGIMHI